jgi:flotillin
MKYRVGGPLIDALMAELGMSGGSVGGLLSGSVPGPIPAAGPAAPKPPRRVADRNGEASPA